MKRDNKVTKIIKENQVILIHAHALPIDKKPTNTY